MHKLTHTNPVVYALLAATLSVSLLLSGFLLAEPVVSHAITDGFTVSQTITGELSFLVAANDVNMDDDTTIAGITGGESLGTSTVTVRTNNPTGYTLSMNFASETAMIHQSATGSIANYTPVGPAENWVIAASAAEFGYSVIAPAAADVGVIFEDDSGTCGSGGGLNTFDECWYGTANATDVVELIDSSSPTNSATTTIRFKVEVAANPSPAVSTGVYTATATLTLLDNA